MNSHMNRKKIILCIVLALLELPFLIAVAYYIGRGIESSQWKSTEGKVISSQINVGHKSSFSPAGGSFTYSKVYSPDIRYEYNVNGKAYKGTRYSFSEIIVSTERESVQKIIDDYPPDKHVQVFYSDEKPSEAALVTGTSWQMFYVLLLLVLGLLFGQFVVFLLFLSNGSKKEIAE